MNQKLKLYAENGGQYNIYAVSFLQTLYSDKHIVTYNKMYSNKGITCIYKGKIEHINR